MTVLRKLPPTPKYTAPQMPPWYYRLAITFLRPLYRFYLAYKKEQLPHSPREIAERFGTNYKRPTPKKGKNVIWCHAVSLGELNTVYPLLLELLACGHALFVTTTTQTGFNRAGTLFEHEVMAGQVVYGFVPVDDLAVVYRFLVCVSPSLAMFVETELWANTLFCLKRLHIKSVVVNARLTTISFERYRRFGALTKTMMDNLSFVIAQDRASFEHFLALGLDEDKIAQADSLKWAQTVGTTQKKPWQRPTWLAASTHEGEEEACLLAHRQLLEQDPTCLLILVPRHPERFETVYKLCRAMGFGVGRFSERTSPKNEQVYVVDTMGQLLNFYGKCDVAVVGGSFVGIGGHNPIEPASLAKPVVMGQYTASCQVLLSELVAVGAAVQVGDEGLAQAVGVWLFDETKAKQAGLKGQTLVQQKSSASVAAQKKHIDTLLTAKLSV